MDDLRPIGLAEAGEAVLGHAGMARAVGFEQGSIDKGVLGVDMKNARAEGANVCDGIDELADEVGGVPFQAEIVAFSLVEEALPDCGLAHGVVVHEGEMPAALGTVFEGDADVAIGGVAGQRLPKGEQLGQEILEGLVKRISAALVHFQLDHRAGKTRDGPDADVRGDVDGALEDSAGGFGLFRIQRIAVEGADGGDADAAGASVGGELLREGFPIGMWRGGWGLGKAHPLHGAEAQFLDPVQFIGPAEDAYTHRARVPWRGQRSRRLGRDGWVVVVHKNGGK